MNPLFASDNVTSACPEVMDALIEANLGIAGSYGDDEWSSILKTTLSNNCTKKIVEEFCEDFADRLVEELRFSVGVHVFLLQILNWKHLLFA